MQLAQLCCLIVIGTLCGVKGRTILIDWTLAGVQNYTESTPLQTDLGDILELSCQSISNLFIQTDLIQYESCNASEGSGLFQFVGFCFSGGQLITLSLTENSQNLMNTINLENNRIYYFTSYSNGSLHSAYNQSINYGGQCADGLKMVVLIGENPTPPATTLPTVPPTSTQCSVDGEILSYLVNVSDHIGMLSRFEGTFDVCVGGFYGSVCDIGWNQATAQVVCYNQFGNKYVATPVYGLDNSGRTYAAQNVTCSDSAVALTDCSYVTSISSECYNGPHAAGVKCTEIPPPPTEVQGLCSIVVWRSPYLPCRGEQQLLQGYDVRLYRQQQSVTRRVRLDETFYILKDEDRLVGSGEDIYVQVRVIYNNIIGEWSEGTSLGCDMPTDPPLPGVYFEINGKIYLNNSVLPIVEVGENEGALYCKTDKQDCCGAKPNRHGDFFYPNGVHVPTSKFRHGFYRNRGEHIVRLNRRMGIVSPTGRYRCEIPNADGDVVSIYITLAD